MSEPKLSNPELQKMVDTSLGILRGMNERIDLIEGIIDTVIALRDELGFTKRIADKLALDYDDLLGKFAEQKDELGRKEARIKELKRQITIKDASLHDKNLSLDSMWYVWCTGGCAGATNRWKSAPPITEELVKKAELNVKRLREYWENLPDASKESHAEPKE